MGEPTATQVMLTLPPGMISWLTGRMEKRGATRRTADETHRGNKKTKRNKSKSKTKKKKKKRKKIRKKKEEKGGKKKEAYEAYATSGTGKIKQTALDLE